MADKKKAVSKPSKPTPKATEKSSGIDTTNPMGFGVTYEAFLKNVTKENTVDKLCKKHGLSSDEIAWIKQEIELFF